MAKILMVTETIATYANVIVRRDLYDLGIELTITGRDGSVEWTGTASTSQLRRRFDELVGYLMRADIHPDGAVLSTGTCLVPPAPFTLEEGHTVRITVTGIGTLENPVVRGLAAMVSARDNGSSAAGDPL